ncbi:MAG: hypothetical protein A4S16_03825 [Proteobacteria bacterium SG_bin6]|nr:MAG: hypothetical protein A4S16_03825 [Proteobacteria bacterium SG_bin6]
MASQLRRKLIYAALAVLERDGAQRVSLRGVAAAAGVSAMAPYHHFADRSALLAAVAQRGLERLYAAQMIAARRAPPSAAPGAAAGALIRHAAAFPELFRLATSAELARAGVHPGLDAARARVRDHFAALIGARGALLHALAQGLAAQVVAGAVPLDTALAQADEGAAALGPSA